MFSVNNLRLGTITATDYCLGSVPVQKMYLGSVLVFDRTPAATITYSDITITDFSYDGVVPASGGTATPTVTYSQTFGYNGATTGGGTITSGATLQFAGGAVNASNGQYTYATKGTELSEQTDTQVTVTVSLNGKTKTATANASQAANTRTAVITDSEFTTAYRDFPASGMANVSWGGYGNITHEPKAEWQYTSGSKANIEASYQWIDGTDHNIPSRGTTVGERQKVLQKDGEWYLSDQCTFVEGDLEVLSYKPELWQKANEITDTQYTEWTIIQSNIDDVSAEGDTITVNPSIKRTKTDTYTSTATKQTEETSTEFTLQSNQSWAVVNGKNINVSQNTGGERSATITITSNGKSTTFTITQSTGQTITSYGDITINGGSATDIPASGGTVKASGCTATIQVTYSSGSTGTVTVPSGNITYTEVNAASLGTTVKARTKVGTSTCNVSYQGKSASKQIDVYQQANSSTATDIDYGTWQVSVSANPTSVAASGGTSTITRSATRTRKQNYTWTSGATSQSDLSNETATPTLGVSGTGFSLNGTTVTATSNVPAKTYTLQVSNPTGDLEEGPDQELTTTVTSTYTQPSSNSRSCTVTATHGGVSKQVTISQSGQSQSSGNQDWTVAKGTNMQTATKSGNTITMVPNAEYGNKNETYTATCTVTQTTSNKTQIVQGRWYKGYLNVSPTTLEFDSNGGTKTINIDTNLNWKIVPQ